MSGQTPQEITKNIIAALAITAPGLSLEIGTPERKIIEAAAEAAFEAKIDTQLIAPQLDIDTKSGVDLEDFVGVFNYGRIQGTYATGVISFTLTIPAVQPILIPYGSQVFKPATLSEASIAYTTTAATIIDVGQQTISVPAQATIVGTAANAPSATITGFPSGLGITACTNVDPFSGGSDDETDDALRQRFKDTFLRNIAGTSDFYTALALQARSVKRVNILGPLNRFDTQIATGAAATPVNVPSKNCKYVWPEGYVVSKNRGTASQEWFTDTVDYSITTGSISFPVLTPTATTDNDFLDVSYDYTSTNSRNDPLRGISNKIDMYVDGSAPVQILEKIFTKAITLSATTTNRYWIGNFKSYPSGTTLTGGSTKFQRLGSTPIVSWPTTIVIGATTYTLGTNYVGVRDITLNKGSEREISGIIWLTTPPADGLTGLITYTYNQVPEVLNNVIKKTKQITSDPMVHAARKKFLSIYLIVQYVAGANPSDVQARVESAMATYFNNLSFGSWIQFSDIATYVHNVQGIDNCRMALLADGAPHSIAEVEAGVLTGVTYTADFQMPDDEIPALDSVHLIRRSFNNFA